MAPAHVGSPSQELGDLLVREGVAEANRRSAGERCGEVVQEPLALFFGVPAVPVTEQMPEGVLHPLALEEPRRCVNSERGT